MSLPWDGPFIYSSLENYEENLDAYKHAIQLIDKQYLKFIRSFKERILNNIECRIDCLKECSKRDIEETFKLVLNRRPGVSERPRTHRSIKPMENRQYMDFLDVYTQEARDVTTIFIKELRSTRSYSGKYGLKPVLHVVLMDYTILPR